jgi:cytochrome c oxidase assembly protein Cox11
VSPINAAKHFGMKVCFCFNDQDIEPYGKRSFPVVYSFSPDLDQRVESTTLCYSLFRIAEGVAPSAEMLRIEAEVKGHGAIVGRGGGKTP